MPIECHYALGCLKKTTFLKSIGAQGYSGSPDHGEFSGVIFIEIGAGLGGAQRA